MAMKSQSLEAFSTALGEKIPVPGGGGASAYVAALAASLGQMVTVYTIGKKTYADSEPLMISCREALEATRVRLLEAIDDDAEAFEPLSKAYGLPRNTEEETAERNRILELCLRNAAAAPFSVMTLCGEIADCIRDVAEQGSKLMKSDAGCAAEFCRAALISASYNVSINTRLMKDRDYAEALNARAEALLETYVPQLEAISQGIREELKA